VRQRHREPAASLVVVATLLLTVLVCPTAAAQGGSARESKSKKRDYGLPLPDQYLDDVRELEKKTQKQPSIRPPSAPIAIEAASYDARGPAPRVLSRTFTGHSLLTRDGAQVVYVDADGLFVAPTAPGKARKLDEPAPFFRLTPDARYVLVPGEPFKRLSVRAEDGPTAIGYRERVNRPTGGPISNEHIAFITADGPIAVASVVEGTSTRLPMGVPEDRRCHHGAGFPHALSDDGKWLAFQHGCSANELIRIDGTRRQKLGAATPRFVGDVVVWTDIPGDRKVQVMDLTTEKRWHFAGTNLGHGARRVPGRRAFFQADRDNRLLLIDVDKNEVRTLHQGEERVTSFVRVTTDGKRGLFATMHGESCAVHEVHLESGKYRRLALAKNARQCFIEPIGARRAVLYAWRAGTGTRPEAIIASIDLDTGHVRRLGPVLRATGNLTAAGETFTLSAGETLYVGRP
jgi:hypothetical protein